MTKQLIAALVLMALAGCGSTETPTEPTRVLTPVSFDDLPGWQKDHQLEAVSALQLSCEKQRNSAWTEVCSQLLTSNITTDAMARGFLTDHFQPYAVTDRDNPEGLFTGYYEATLHGSKVSHNNYLTPIYATPNDLLHADLGAFRPEWKGKKLTGKVIGHSFVPYDDRRAIVAGTLNQRAEVLAYVDDPIDAFFLAIQGSGCILLDDGSEMRVGYDDANGHDYVAIGKVLLERGDLERPVGMNSIRTWLREHPADAEDMMNHNSSYVFFHVNNQHSPIGAEGLPLTPLRSLAVDPSIIPLGSPVWLDTEDNDGEPLQQLMVAQDVGGAIKGIVRGDVFWGYGPEAEAKAGPMQSKGRYFLLLPKDYIIP